MSEFSITITYRAPDGRSFPVTAARVSGEFFFPFTDIASALLYECPERMRPTCDAAEVSVIPFPGKRYPRKCVTLEGLFEATPASRTDDGTQDAAGAARHFHGWLRTVMLPALESGAWPPDANATLDLQLEWTARERDRLADHMRELESTRAAPTGLQPASQVIAAAPDSGPIPAVLREKSHVFPDSAGFAIDNCDDFLAV